MILLSLSGVLMEFMLLRQPQLPGLEKEMGKDQTLFFFLLLFLLSCFTVENITTMVQVESLAFLRKLSVPTGHTSKA